MSTIKSLLNMIKSDRNLRLKTQIAHIKYK